MTSFLGLPPCNPAGNRDFPEHTRFETRKTQHIRRVVDAAKRLVELLDFRVADEGDGHEAAGTRRCDACQPAGQTGGPHAASAAITHLDAQRGSRSRTLRTL